MDAHPHVALGTQDPQPEDLLISDGDFSAPSSSVMAVNNQKPDLAKRPTRQWAAWTRQEEENFFNALRQVGKNFEKITCRVESKNRNQVRHYYYRLVRRMNKLLGPGLCLDAKNSKDTNAAMLRWWSLLEKHSCTASKLHLKPRRYKMFVEALGNQLLKDRNKGRRKRPQGEKYTSASSITLVPNKELVTDGHHTVHTQNTHKLEDAKGPYLKRNMSSNSNFNKVDLPPTRPVRQKRRPGLVASSACRRREKVAIGVSFLADAAELLERATNGGSCSVGQGNFSRFSTGVHNTAGQKDIDLIGNSGGQLYSPTQMVMCSPQTADALMQPPVKLKLQLFPINEVTRQTLEKDACNPHLELTLSGRKRISSILEHLNRKWGNSSIASGELMLLPYNAQQKDTSKQRWTAKDTISSAADVFASVGSPAVFRLRYGWFTNAEPMMRSVQVSSPACSNITMQAEDFQEGFDMDVANRETANIESPISAVTTGHISEQPVGPSPLSSPSSVPEKSKDELPVSSEERPSWSGEKTQDGYCREQQEVSLGTRNALSAADWADSLTNVSIGDLLSEASKAAKFGFGDSSLGKCSSYPEEIPFSCDSFDAAIAAHISAHKLSRISTQESPSSMWNAEETCDEFSFHSLLSPSIEDNRQAAVSGSPFQGYLKEFNKPGSSNGPLCANLEVELEPAKDTVINQEKDEPSKDANLMDIYWPDSLGPFDLEMPSSSRYNQGHDLVLGDGNNFASLGRMIANSLDGFQNCSFFGMDKKE